MTFMKASVFTEKVENYSRYQHAESVANRSGVRAPEGIEDMTALWRRARRRLTVWWHLDLYRQARREGYRAGRRVATVLYGGWDNVAAPTKRMLARELARR